jgi:hypothetical protein
VLINSQTAGLCAPSARAVVSVAVRDKFVGGRWKALGMSNSRLRVVEEAGKLGTRTRVGLGGGHGHVPGSTPGLRGSVNSCYPATVQYNTLLKAASKCTRHG